MANTYPNREPIQSMISIRQSPQSHMQLQLEEPLPQRVTGNRDIASQQRLVNTHRDIQQTPLYLDEVDVQAYTPVRRSTHFSRPRERIQRRLELAYESNCIPFRSILTPMSGLTATKSDNGSKIQFVMAKDHSTGFVTLQWEPFQGKVSGGGTECLEVQQSIGDLPEFEVDLSIIIEVRGVRKPAFVRIDPYSNNNIKFYLDITGTGVTISNDDKVFVPASCVQWKSAR